ncbi:MAG TPA: response regulator [Kribbella sp.]|nr:response regulator [Kribbella sp.]
MALRCFIVDDSPHFVAAAQALLERDGFVVVGVASTAEEAVRRVEATRPDAVLIDVELGADNGFDLARRLDTETGLDRSRLIMISTYSEDDLWDLITAAPVAAFLPKARLSAGAIREILDGSVDGDSS